METTRLKSTRLELGWSQKELISVLRKRAALIGMALPADDSLKTEISRHENGHVHPDAAWRRLYRLAYGRTDEELGFAAQPTEPDVIHDLRHRLDAAYNVDTATVLELQQRVDRIRMVDRRHGAHGVLEQTRSLLGLLHDLSSYSLRPGVRRELAAVLADAAALAGWQALDVGAVTQAWQHCETAKAAAREAESVPLLAHAMGQQAFVLIDIGQGKDAVDLLQAARRTMAHRGPSLLTAWVNFAEAEALAALAEAGRCRKALSAAMRALPERPVDPRLPYIFLTEPHVHRWRGHCLTRLGDPAAVPELNTALRQMDPSFRRAEAGLRCDLAYALFSKGQVEEARPELTRAWYLAERVGSLRQRRRIERLAVAI